jgi:hypothetical protein
MELPPFEPFASIPRLKRGCVITEKIDGTNAQVYVGEGGLVIAGSRNRWITPEDDNYGFAKWVAEHTDELRALGPGRHYGEWWGVGVQRRYDLAEKRFSLFNAGRWSSERPACCHVVPVLYAGDFSTDVVAETMESLRINGSLAAPLFMQPEGVVVYMTASKHLYKVTFDDAHKGGH